MLKNKRGYVDTAAKVLIAVVIGALLLFGTALTTAPTIPSSVTEMCWTFQGCTSLTRTIEINTNPTSYYDSCFKDTTKPIILTGSSSKLAEIATTANKGNVTVQQ